jgi:hypothetical protein
VKEGKMEVAPDGRNKWNADGKGQFYIIEKVPYRKCTIHHQQGHHAPAVAEQITIGDLDNTSLI